MTSRLAEHFAIVALFFLSGLGCISPGQSGSLRVAPGAGERVMFAMRYGYAMGGTSQPAGVRRVIYPVQLPAGPGIGGRRGDWVLDNGIMIAVIGAIDGSPRSGALIDVAQTPGGLDALDVLQTEVCGESVVYEALTTGTDAMLGSAYVSVTGHVDRSAEGGPVLSVETRYDLAPKLDTVLISTSVTVERSASDDWVERDHALSDRLSVFQLVSRALDPRTPQLVALGSAGGYALQPMSGGESRDDGFAWPIDQLREVGDSALHIRALVSLHRPDSASAELAHARTLGEPTGELELRLRPTKDASRTLGRGDLVLSRHQGSQLVARGLPACGARQTYSTTLPAGIYEVSFRNGRHQSVRPAIVKVVADRRTGVELIAAPTHERYVAPEALSRCSSEEASEGAF